MALVPCKVCQKEVASTAVACPHCGAPYPGTVIGKLEISRRGQFIGSLQNLDLFVNNEKVASIAPSTPKVIDLPEGKHSIRASVGLMKSEPFDVVISAGHTTRVESWAESGLLIAKLLFRII